jgi:large subunit ribosomal protein L1
MRSKRYKGIREEFSDSECSIAEAVAKVKEAATAKFDESIEVAIYLGVDPSKSDQMVRGNVVLPNGTGKEVRVAVVTEDEKDIKTALEAGADIAGKEEILEAVKKGTFNFDILISTPGCMKDLGKFGKVLGPKGLMPSPKSGTVTKDVKDTVQKIKKGQVEFKMDKNGVIHGIIGKASFPAEKLVENFEHYVETIRKNRPAAAKGKFIKRVHIASSMGPSVSIAV